MFFFVIIIITNSSRGEDFGARTFLDHPGINILSGIS